ncbi:hypothetical protein PHYBLDRAFT_161545 [Phycomyces blakesleeanus NRRL 1555(-)]|uniref:Uncharacterized protein n=1 Tax=Phycomyces blakesleeanus (strain ATCC 8743b / DSM 1359 / FGSC 10004 / NBRC 33097 / NRRL 1555) TaxID=763407 RepID=A0A163EQS9_PHYB8|nr:hypothetical protein PHYBLDRAFT_161545 [Phycomyces blakesleeanus NRRL 1555(-)]OAD80910.1 hypothetical protein PHYBLDRAFT_161545 [Phycomyces blakesleeanus NRRL 1555(-)]|eukprot:XP_018298950.1 hypothetical protein PHYBLDRAFT_161545 [Phycomyces blakesleeanus NRRL 1555(-)]
MGQLFETCLNFSRNYYRCFCSIVVDRQDYREVIFALFADTAYVNGVDFEGRLRGRYGAYYFVTTFCVNLSPQTPNSHSFKASYAEDHKELLSLKCGAILLNISLFIGLLTRIMSLSLFYLMFPKFGKTNWEQIEPFHAGKKVRICGPVESNCRLPQGNFVP